jgi:hypothetical protein
MTKKGHVASYWTTHWTLPPARNPWKHVEAPIYIFTSTETHSRQPRTITDWVYVFLPEGRYPPRANTTSDPYPDVSFSRVLTRGELCDLLHYRCSGAPLLCHGCPPPSKAQANQIMNYRFSLQLPAQTRHPSQHPRHGYAHTTQDMENIRAKLSALHGAHTPETTFCPTTYPAQARNTPRSATEWPRGP